MTRRSSMSLDIRIVMNVVDQQEIQTSYTTPEFKLETFSSSLHLPPPIPIYNFADGFKTYIGHPMIVNATVQNNKAVKMRLANIKLIGKVDSKNIFTYETPPADIQPNSLARFQYSYTPQHLNDIQIQAKLKFYIENSKLQLKDEIKIQVLPIATLEYKPIPNSNSIQIYFRNIFKRPLSHIHISTDGGDLHKVSHSLQPDCEIADIVEITKPHSHLIATFSTPTARKLSVHVPYPNEGRVEKEEPIKLVVTGVPNFIPMMSTFKCNISLINCTGKPIDGRIQVAELNDSILAYGNNELSFHSIIPTLPIDLPIEFVALKQGSYSIPSFDIFYDDSKHIRVKTELGCIVVGNSI